MPLRDARVHRNEKLVVAMVVGDLFHQRFFSVGRQLNHLYVDWMGEGYPIFVERENPNNSHMHQLMGSVIIEPGLFI